MRKKSHQNTNESINYLLVFFNNINVDNCNNNINREH